MEAADDKEQQRLLEIRCWHARRFASLGFNRQEAELLELARVDWHDAQALLERGCSHEVAVHILI